jgi:hypothetical protein
MLCTSPKAGKRSVLIFSFMPSKKGDGGATGRRRFEDGMMMRRCGLERMNGDGVADKKSTFVNFIFTRDADRVIECCANVYLEEAEENFNQFE